MIICAKDGWVDIWNAGIGPYKWNYLGCKKYRDCHIYCLDKDGAISIAKPQYIHSGIIQHFFNALFNRKVTVKITFTMKPELSINSFKELLIEAVKSDNDILTFIS